VQLLIQVYITLEPDTGELGKTGMRTALAGAEPCSRISSTTPAVAGTLPKNRTRRNADSRTGTDPSRVDPLNPRFSAVSIRENLPIPFPSVRGHHHEASSCIHPECGGLLVLVGIVRAGQTRSLMDARGHPRAFDTRREGV